MSYTRQVSNVPLQIGRSAADAVNELIQAQVTQGVIVHHRVDQVAIDALAAVPVASSLGTSQTLARALALAMVAHGADTQAHTTVVAIDQAAAWASAPAVPVNLVEVQNVLNELKGDINTHVLNTTAHRAVWGTPGVAGAITGKAITTADATDQTTANALANAVQLFLLNHMRAGCSSIEIIST